MYKLMYNVIIKIHYEIHGYDLYLIVSTNCQIYKKYYNFALSLLLWQQGRGFFFFLNYLFGISKGLSLRI